jgi:hypothetical protein
MGRKLQRFRAVIDHPVSHLRVGLILILTGVVEAYDGLAEGSGRLRAHHGIVILGLFQVLLVLPHVISGLEKWVRAFEKRRRAGGQEGG